MLEITKQYFDKQLGKLATKEEIKKLATKEDVKILDKKIGGLDVKIDGLDVKIENEVASLAGMMSRRFDELERKLDVRAEVDQLKLKMNKVWQVLDIKN
ncbi:MAG: hypothetical protein HYT62_04090 [Candidatus Yanofskybacteria bacterium]|nr:hypothetical protein [Candidatus Yanofskybacteria bacterium]